MSHNTPATIPSDDIRPRALTRQERARRLLTFLAVAGVVLPVPLTGCFTWFLIAQRTANAVWTSTGWYDFLSALDAFLMICSVVLTVAVVATVAEGAMRDTK